MRKIFLKKSNNKGSSLIIVLIAIAFVSILVAVILSAATANYRLRVMNNNSKKTFYSAETALEEVYAGLGEVTCNIMEEAYLGVAQNLSRKEIVGGHEYTIKISNEEANAKLKVNYYTAINNMIRSYIDAEAAGSGTTLTEYLSTFLSSPDNAYVSDYGNITYYDEDLGHNVVIIEDVVVQYKKSKDSYFSTVTTDIEFMYPNDEFDFISNTKSTLETFLDYSIIAMDGLQVGKGTLTANTTIAGGAFAGNEDTTITGGIVVDDGSTLNVGNNILSSTIISSSDLTVLDNSVLNFTEGKLWCININAGSDEDSNARVIFGQDTTAYVADDLNVEGYKCAVTLGPDYSGYGYNSKAEGGYSSAIVVNGKKCVIHATNLDRLVLGGRAFLNMDGEIDEKYMTADSISLRGNQEVYLVPLRYINRVAGAAITVTNPLNAANLTYVDVDLTKFWAYELLDSSNPYKVYNLEGVCYFYLNFRSISAQKEYIKCILSETYLQSVISASHLSDPEVAANWHDDRTELLAHITSSMSKFVFTHEGNGITLSYNSDAEVYAAGNLYEVGSTTSIVDNTINIADLTLYCRDKANRFSILQSFLADVGSDSSDTGYAVMPDTIAIAGNVYSTADVTTMSIYNRVIDTDKLSAATENYINERTDGTIAAVIVEGNYEIPSYIVGGVVLGYNCDITVSRDFEGLIITNGKVSTYKTGTITNGIRDVASRILDEDVRISKYFYAYQMDTTNDHSTSIVEVDDLLSFNNWRKNYAD